MHRFKPILGGMQCHEPFGRNICQGSPLPERSPWLRHHRICMTLLTFWKVEGLLDDVPTIDKVFRDCKLQRRSIDLG
jgi:hypothetical protein